MRRQPVTPLARRVSPRQLPSSRYARECQIDLLRRPSANAVRLHVDLVHLFALLSAVLVRALQTRRFYFAPGRHAAAHLRGYRVVAIAGRRDVRNRRASSYDGDGRKQIRRAHVDPPLFVCAMVSASVLDADIDHAIVAKNFAAASSIRAQAPRLDVELAAGLLRWVVTSLVVRSVGEDFPLFSAKHLRKGVELLHDRHDS